MPLAPRRSAVARLVPALALLAGLTACAGDDGAGWTKPGVAPAQRAADSRACRAQADDHAMRRANQPDRLDPNGPGAFDNPMAQVERTEARDAHRRFYAECMRAHGYARQGR
jgi:hypothetical protein